MIAPSMHSPHPISTHPCLSLKLPEQSFCVQKPVCMNLGAFLFIQAKKKYSKTVHELN